ncbi:unnamed protein product [Symbiodinium natans]|uniref:Uncharacterized protein n=1 Tax=Symbiodinium natans TaxID=878477 RepID=A0A812UM14_9DINO|nr:unnamed protein product [Symbiodinium natans]
MRRSRVSHAPRKDSPWDALQQSEALFGEAGSTFRLEEAGRLLTKDALDMLTSWFRPAQEGLDSASSETSDGVDDALAALLKDEVPYVVEFLSDKQFPGPVCRAFWQSELYLRDFQQVAGQAPLEEFTQSAKHATGAVEDMLQDGSDMPQALDRLVTRQQFAAAVRFGYFLRRAKQRLRLESIMTGPVGTLEVYLAEMTAQQQVELVRAASREASSAIDVRATALFGKASELLRGVASGDILPLQLSPEGRARLAVEAVAFGAALFDAEEAAAQHYTLTYSEFGSRSPQLLPQWKRLTSKAAISLMDLASDSDHREQQTSDNIAAVDTPGRPNESMAENATTTTSTSTATSTASTTTHAAYTSTQSQTSSATSVSATSTLSTSTSTTWQATSATNTTTTSSHTATSASSTSTFSTSPTMDRNTTATYTTNTSTSSTTTSTATLSTLSTTTTTTTVHIVTLTGVILTKVSSPSRFLSDAQVPPALARAMATLIQVPADSTHVELQIVDARQIQADSAAVEVTCATTLQGPNATERAETAKQLLIRATPSEIAELMSSEVNGLQVLQYVLEVLEVAPPAISGPAVQVPDQSGSGGAGVVFDPQDLDGGMAVSPNWPCALLLAAVAVL